MSKLGIAINAYITGLVMAICLIKGFDPIGAGLLILQTGVVGYGIWKEPVPTGHNE